MRPQARRAIRTAAGFQRRFVKRINFSNRFRTKTDMAAAVRRTRRHAGTQVDPEFRLGFAETDGGGPCHNPGKAERRQCRFIKAH